MRDGSTPGPTAPQVLGLMREVPAQDEDCLRLNVWTPALHGRRPVLVFLHGGAFTTGTCAHPMYDGRELARRGDAVVVSLELPAGRARLRRISPRSATRASAPTPTTACAINSPRWPGCASTSPSFGGDPERITLFGQSAGAMSVGTLLTLSAARGSFQRAIAQSGAAHHVTTRADSVRIAERLLDTLGIRPNELERLRELPFEAIARAQSACLRQWISVGRGAAIRSSRRT